MGHAGAIISGGSGKAADKMAALQAAGVTVVTNIGELGLTVKRVMGYRVVS
jgi:succinyl-CoA synthetase alpha subunit